MQIQFHPASGSGAVRTFWLGEKGQRAAIAFAGLVLFLSASLWLTVPSVMARRARESDSIRLGRELAARQLEWNRSAELALSLRRRALEQGDLLNRIAFLYGVSAEDWPRVLNPERGLLAESEPARAAASLDLYLRALEKGRALLAAREKGDADRALRVPAVVPIERSLFEPSAFFGPRTSPWTGEEEFFLGVDLAAPNGSAVVATGGGVVVFAGTVRRSAAGHFWRLGNIVVVSHADSGATIYGHLARIDVRRGQRVARGDPLGTVGSTGWAMSPLLHWEYWRPEKRGLRPTDPLFATLDHRLGRVLSVEQMEATSAPGPLDPIPGIQIGAGEASGPHLSSPNRSRRPARRRRI